MWVNVAVWEVQTGEVEQLAVGDRVEWLGVRATFWDLEPSEADEGIHALPGRTPAGDESPYYRVVGTVDWIREPHSLVVRVGSISLLAEPRPVGLATTVEPDGLPPEALVPEVRLPEVGERVALVATLSSLLPYEPEAYGYPDVSRDWVVEGLRVEHRETVPSPAYPGGSEPGRVLRVVEIPRMLRWADAPRKGYATYLLDLVPDP
ncbi:MAG TPA: hypothetical protein VH228_16395 [Nocardioides sp.]|nr:hypothetical protein [Nocardioides sp.]